MTIITDNIAALQLCPLSEPLLWQLRFRSENPDCYHQLYINGRLADITDTPAQRSFDLCVDTVAQELAVVAVPAKYRNRDLAGQLPLAAQELPWLCPLRILRDAQHRLDETLRIRHDRATGTLDAAPALYAPLWPPEASPWGFGVEHFGEGGFGLDASFAPGLRGAFGLGPFGIDRECLSIDLPLGNNGLHQIELRTGSARGGESAPTLTSFTAAPPPRPIAALCVTDYDPEHELLTLHITRG